jgi:hypothetical protein
MTSPADTLIRAHPILLKVDEDYVPLAVAGGAGERIA